MAQKVTAEYVAEVIKRNQCDRMAAYDRSGKVRYDYREGAPEELADAVQALCDNTVGLFQVEVWRYKGPGKKGLSSHALRFTLSGATDEQTTAAQSIGGGPSWREYYDLREQMMRRDLEQEQEDKSSAVIAQVLPIAQDLIKAVLLQRAAVTAPIQGVPEKSAPGTSAMDDDLKQALRAVAIIHDADPDTFHSYAPLIISKAAELKSKGNAKPKATS